MRLAYYIKKRSVKADPELASWLGTFSDAGIEVYPVTSAEELREGTDVLMAIGGDGTFLNAASMLSGTDVPVLGVNRGRLGFLSENHPEDVLEPLLNSHFKIESREVLSALIQIPGKNEDVKLPGGNYALNEISLLRSTPRMVGIDVELDGAALPTYWADGILVSTSSGSTAYNLSAGGPICHPDVRAHIITPVAPHNLNVRPLLTSSSSCITLVARDGRGDSFQLSLDNRNFTVPEGSCIRIESAPFSVKVLRLDNASFVRALEDKLFWGEDIRNSKSKNY